MTIKNQEKTLDLFHCSYEGDLLCGVDEVGRGPLAGDVVTAAVILSVDKPIDGLMDSKKLTPKRREILFDKIMTNAKAVCIARASVAEIDQLNILQASLLAMHRAVAGLEIQPEFVLVDGNKIPRWNYASEAVVKGDDRVSCIAAASIIAKVTRDREMVAADADYPGYGFAQHKGYPTKVHFQALADLGVCDIHRKSYAPVQRYLAASE